MKAKTQEHKLTQLSGRKGTNWHVNIDADVSTYRVAFASQKDTFYLIDDDGDDIGKDSTRAKLLGDKYKGWTDEQLSKVGLSVHKESELDPWEDVAQRILGHFQSIIVHTDARTWSLFLTGKGNWRDNIATVRKYKAGRAEKPLLYKEIRKFMVEELGAIVYNGIEADDALSIASWEALRKAYRGGAKTLDKCAQKSNVILASIDKDLKQTCGWFYNPAWEDQAKPYNVSSKGSLEWSNGKLHFDGLKGFYAQILMGDSVDAIPGVPGIGPKAAYNALKNCKTEADLIHKCVEVTRDVLGDMHEYYHWRTWDDPHIHPKKMQVRKDKACRPITITPEEYVTEMGHLLYMLRHPVEEGGSIKLWDAPEKYLK